VPAPVSAALYDRIERQFIALVNQRRHAAGLPPYHRSEQLTRAAMVLAYDNECRDRDSGISADGENTAARLRRFGYLSVYAIEQPWDTTAPTPTSAASVYRMIASFGPDLHEMILDRRYFKDIGFGLRCSSRDPAGSASCHGSFILASR
jgi:hypothetical protein